LRKVLNIWEEWDSMDTSSKILSVATVVPPYELDQRDVMERIRSEFGNRSPVVERLLPAFANTGIERRYSCVPLSWYYSEHGWGDRNRVYLDSAIPLLEKVTLEALKHANRAIEEIDAIVVVSTTGIATPSLDALLMQRLPFKRATQRLPIFGLGCAGGVLGLARAASLAQAKPGSLVLFLVVELCTLSFRRQEYTKSNVIATALFGDGAAAALLSTDGSGPAIVASGEYTFPDSLNIMGWDVADDGMVAIFSRDIPQLINDELHTIASNYLSESSLQFSDIDEFICHPGGAKVLDALENAFELKNGALTDSRTTLRDYGNMSAATVMFVLEKALRTGSLSPSAKHWSRALVSSMGPGFTAGFITLENQ
jgi:alkylresorcinol/alkylpyrone synthase